MLVGPTIRKRIFSTVAAAGVVVLLGALAVPTAAFADEDAGSSEVQTTQVQTTHAPAAAPETTTEPAPATATKPAPASTGAPDASESEPESIPAPESAPAPEQTAQAAQDGRDYTINGSIATQKVALIHGQYFWKANDLNRAGSTSIAADNTSTWVLQAWSPDSDTVRAEATFVYQIELLGVATPYWVKGHATISGGYYVTDADCSIYQGDPENGGSKASPAPYRCDSTITEIDNYARATAAFTVSKNLNVEVRGTVTTMNGLALDKGYYELNTTHGQAGEATVGVNGTTWWDSVLLVGDEPPVDANTAKGTFVYRILDNGIPSMYWVKGIADNWSGYEYNHDATCEIYASDPTPGGESEPQPATASPYSCTMSNQNDGIDGRANWMVFFTIAKHDLREVTNKSEQKQLIQTCTDSPENCGLTFSTVTREQGDFALASDILDNSQSDVANAQTWGASRTVSTTNTVGAELDVSYGWGKVYQVGLKLTYSYSITNSSTYTKSDTLTVPAHEVGWWELAPILLRVKGDVIVLKDGIYWEIKDVDATFPMADNFSVIRASYKKPTTGTVGGTEPNPSIPIGTLTPGTTPSGSVPSGSVPSAATLKAAPLHSSGLATTGSHVDDSSLLLGILGVLAGAAILIFRRRRFT